MSSGLCKKLEGAVFPFQVESLEDGVDDSVDAFYVDKADHGSSSAAHFHEAALDDGAFRLSERRAGFITLGPKRLWTIPREGRQL